MDAQIVCYEAKYHDELEGLVGKLWEYICSLDNEKIRRYGHNYLREEFRNITNSVDNNDGEIFLCKVDEKIVGFASVLIKSLDRRDLEAYSYDQEGYLGDLYVLEEYRGRGFGKMLLEKAEDYCREKECGVISLVVVASNKNARKMYENSQYKENSIEYIKKLN